MDVYEQQLFNKELQDSVDKAERNTESFNTFAKEARSLNKEFFFQVAILSAGILSLSVTYIGYASSILISGLRYTCVLFLGWTLLTISLLGGLFRNYLYTIFGHWQMNKNRVEALLEKEKKLLELATECPEQIANIKSKEELNNYKNTLEKNIEKYKKGLKYNANRETKYERLWHIVETSTLIGIGGGTVAIVLFAATNLPL
jgi:uncharacterized FlaG/YvyC family protein